MQKTIVELEIPLNGKKLDMPADKAQSEVLSSGVSFSGSLEYGENNALLFNLVNKEMPEQPFSAVILGGDQGRNVYKKKLLRLVEQYRLNNQVQFFDKCELMPLAYKISDIIVSASIEPEAFGRISVEAQSMEKPIIASNIGGSNETIVNDKTGFLFEAGKPEELSKKIIHALNLNESTLKFIGIEGRKNVIKKFNIEKMCFSTYSEYKKLIN